jgi:hypothetical protein
MEFRPSVSRRETTFDFSIPRETMEIDSVLGSQLDLRHQYNPAREDSEEFQQEDSPIAEPNFKQRDEDRARSRTARPMAFYPEDNTSNEATNQVKTSPNNSLQAKQCSKGPGRKRKRNKLTNAEAPPKPGHEMLPPPPPHSKRKAAVYASKKNYETIKFYNQSSREQSLALAEGRAAAITRSCYCDRLACTICGPLEQIKRDSREQKWR